ncbi:MAG: hypothetical protein ACRDRK_27780 [Pseudonocardia sp.]
MLDDGVGAEVALPGLRGLLRSVRSPEFAGTIFHEVEARSVLNRVPGTSPVPFRWTVNPYRGCTHACTYCAAGETPILLSDGRTRPIAELQVGDAVMGTERVGGRRQYVRTEVRAHWSTTKPAHRVTLAGGAELVTSGEHRFLTESGWRHVTPGWCWSGKRPWLHPGSVLVGPGRSAAPFDGAEAALHGDSYRAGYLYGLVRGDEAAPDRRFPSEHLELEALGRAHHFLAAADRRSPSLAALGGRVPPPREPGGAIRAVREVVCWPLHPDEAWCAGFLAGVVDACGEVVRGELLISHGDEEIIGRSAGALRRLGFRFAVEATGRTDCHVRLLGGPRAFLGFLRRVDPAVTRRRDLHGAPVAGSAELEVVSVRALGVELPMYDITTGTGDFIANGVVSHNCLARYIMHTCEQASTPGSASTGPARGPASNGRTRTADA